MATFDSDFLNKTYSTLYNMKMIDITESSPKSPNDKSNNQMDKIISGNASFTNNLRGYTNASTNFIKRPSTTATTSARPI